MGAVERSRRCVVCRAVYRNGESFCPIDGGAVAERDDDDPYVGRTIDGRYLVHRRLGKGGMGVVYEATHIGLDRRVAIKFLLGAADDADALARFRREARIASKIDHAHVVDILDVGRDSTGTDYLAMELVEGRDLQQIASEGRLDPARAVALVRQILDGLAAIHAAGIVHRDLKPSNVIVVEGATGEIAKIMDFGISKSMSGTADNVTDTGHVIGTPMYMSPEQLLGDPLDPRSDVFSVGLILFALLAGEPAFAGNTMSRIAAMHATVDAPRLSTVRSDLSPVLVDAVATALAIRRDDRFATAKDFADALPADELPAPTKPSDRWMRPTAGISPAPTRREKPAESIRPDGRTALAEPVHSMRRPPIRIAVIAVIAVIVALAGVVLYLVTRSSSQAPVVSQEGVAIADAAIADAAISAIDAPVLDDAVTLARRAEEAGKLPLAIALFEDAVSSNPRPDLVFHLGELHERNGDPAKAAAHFTRYLELAPSATDAAHVRDRIARLVPRKTRVAVTPVAPPAKKGKPRKCFCYPGNGTDSSHFKLCRGLSKTKPCLCAGLDKSVNTWRPLCSTPGSKCSMPQPDCYDGLRCADPTFGKYTAPHSQAGMPCTGYRDGDVAVSGEYRCQVCDPTLGLTYEGHPGDSCVGYAFNNGDRSEGHLSNCN